jgi:transposase
MRAYSADLRERVLADCDGGLGTRAVAARYRVSESWVRRLKQVRRESGRTTPATQRRGPTPGWVAHADAIRAAVAADPDATLVEYRQRFALPLSRSALARALAALGLSRKKSPSGPARRTART